MTLRSARGNRTGTTPHGGPEVPEPRPGGIEPRPVGIEPAELGATLIANTLNWMVQRETHLGIAPKEPEQVRLSLAPQQRRHIFWLVVAGIPAATLIAGIAINMRRRR